MRLHELLMDMITEHNYGVPIPLSHDDHSSHMDDIHTEMEKRLIVFLALPGNLIFIRLKRSWNWSCIWLTLTLKCRRGRCIPRRWNISTGFKQSVNRNWSYSCTPSICQIAVSTSPVSPVTDSVWQTLSYFMLLRSWHWIGCLRQIFSICQCH